MVTDTSISPSPSQYSILLIRRKDHKLPFIYTPRRVDLGRARKDNQFIQARDSRLTTNRQIVRTEFGFALRDSIYILLVRKSPTLKVSSIIANELRSPALIPKPDDWGARISVSGFYFMPLASDYTPPANLQAFLDAGNTPIYIGFGSIIVDNPKYLTILLLEAIQLAGVRAVISTGWSGLGDLTMPPEVLTIAECPHDWIFERVSCVVHHGGAGTTAAAIAAGKPSVVVPFFGDQPFWGKMIARVGAGPEPIPFKKLTAVRLAAAIGHALGYSVQRRSRSLRDLVNQEDGVQAGVRSFYQQLDLSLLKCSFSPMIAATWRVRKTEIRLGSTGCALLMDMGLLDLDRLEL